LPALKQYRIRGCLLRRSRRQPGIHAERVRLGHVVLVFEAIFVEARNYGSMTVR
jgi:hypothetical protein